MITHSDCHAHTQSQRTINNVHRRESARRTKSGVDTLRLKIEGENTNGIVARVQTTTKCMEAAIYDEGGKKIVGVCYY